MNNNIENSGNRAVISTVEKKIRTVTTVMCVKQMARKKEALFLCLTFDIQMPTFDLMMPTCVIIMSTLVTCDLR